MKQSFGAPLPSRALSPDVLQADPSGGHICSLSAGQGFAVHPEQHHKAAPALRLLIANGLVGFLENI